MRRPAWHAALPLSFRQLLLVAFLCVAGVLGGALLRALMTLEALAGQNRDDSVRAVRMIENVQLLDAQTATLERRARQYVVLHDRALLDSYEDAWRDAQVLARRLNESLPPPLQPLIGEWLARARVGHEVLAESGTSSQPEDRLSEGFRRLRQLNERLALSGKQYVDQRNIAVLDDLERQRAALTVLAVGAIAVSSLLALGFGLWLSGPLLRVEAAIARLGEHRLDEPVEIYGPVDMRRLGRQLDWLRLRLMELEDNKARFLRHVSHELKSPLSAIREGVALLEDETAGELTGNQREVAVILRENSVALQEQIEGLLQFNASLFESRRLRRQAVDLRTLIGDVLQRQRLQWQGRSLRVRVRGTAPAAHVDPEKIEVVIGNLLSNAIRFSSDGSSIEFVIGASAGGVCVDCIDDGPGVAPEDTEGIFEPFRQGVRQPPGARHGSGIGLSIVRELVGAHGGAVILMPTVAGAHFRITLPGNQTGTVAIPDQPYTEKTCFA